MVSVMIIMDLVHMIVGMPVQGIRSTQKGFCQHGQWAFSAS